MRTAFFYQHRRSLLCSLIITAVIIGSYYWSILHHHRPYPHYQGTALIGNGRLLVPVDSRGTFIGLYWPKVGRSSHLHNPHGWANRPERIPLSTGVLLGVQREGQPVTWLRDAVRVTQAYTDATNILATDYFLADGAHIRVEDWVLPADDVILRHVVVLTPQTGTCYLVAYQHLNLMDQPTGDQCAQRDGLLMQWRVQPEVAIALGSTGAPSDGHLGDPASFSAIEQGRWDNRSERHGDSISALKWLLTGGITLAYAVAPTPQNAAATLRQVLHRPINRLHAQSSASTASWLASGREIAIPSARLKALYTRSLLTLKLLQNQQSGGVLGGAREYWDFCWPRDGVFAAAAFDLTGHHSEAEALYRFLAGTQRPDGSWEARSQTDGQPVADQRALQMDSPGYLPWGVWLHARTMRRLTLARVLYPNITRACDYILAHQHPATHLPGPGADYWEYSKKPSYHLSNSIVCWAGLTAAAELARSLDRPDDASRFAGGAERIAHGIRTVLWSERKQSYIRATHGFDGVDSAACWAVSPFGLFTADDPRMRATVARVEARLTTQRGGIIPGEDWRKPDPWVAETAFPLLYWIAAGDMAKADRYFTWLADSATPAGTLPEIRSIETNLPASTTPLTWSHAAFVLAVVARWGGGIPMPEGAHK